MENLVNETVNELDYEQKPSLKWYANWKFITAGVVIAIALLFAGISYFQATRFNANITINGISAGGLTAEQALTKLESSMLKNKVFVGTEMIVDGKDTTAGFSKLDLPGINKILKNQRTLLPTSTVKNYLLMPINGDKNQPQRMQQQLQQKLTLMNKSLQAPQDAEARIVQGVITVTKSKDGKQYDVAAMMKEYQKQAYNSEILLNPIYIQPVKENSPIVKNEVKSLQALLQRTINYTVQDKVYPLKASELIKNATLSKNNQYSIDTAGIQNKLAEINDAQATLNKNFTFKTHTGQVISVKGEGYGWAIDVGKETARLQEAFEKGLKSLSASNIYGNGWDNSGIGYQTTANNGLGGTYAEVSIEQQRIWIYKNGQLAVTTNVVTGRHDVNEDTPKGVWYILYKQSPSTLVGSEVGNLHYSVKVAYWAPFTNSGDGLHDASWRTNWASNAYLTDGSGGCVNTPPSIMGTVYNNLVTNEPVIVY